MPEETIEKPDEEVEVPETEETEEPSGSETEETPEDTEEENKLTDKEEKEAQNLYKLLKNPQTSKSVLKVLAEQAGIFDQPIQTKTEVKDAKKDLKAILKEKLGKDLEWLVPKLGDAMEEILDQERTSQNARVDEIENQKVKDDVVRVSEKLNRETKGDYKRLEARMNQLSDEILPAPGMSVEKYCRHLYAIANSERKGNQQKSNLADKINRNATNAAERIGSKGSPSKSDQPTGKMSLKEAVAFAAKQQEKK